MAATVDAAASDTEANREDHYCDASKALLEAILAFKRGWEI